MTQLQGIGQRACQIRATISEACAQSGRDPQEVLLIGVSKTVDVDAVEQAITAGIHDFGENRPCELARKHDAFPEQRWHFIGNIQSRQLNQVVGRAYLIHSLWDRDHASRIDRLAAAAGVIQDVLIEVNDGEDNKQGLDPRDLWPMLEHCATLPHLRVRGLMIMAPAHDPQRARQTFASLACLRDETAHRLVALGADNIALDELSMGMTDDYPLAILEGATMVRVGRALFSEDS